MFNFHETFPNYDVDMYGIVYKDGYAIKPFKSNNYSQVVLFDTNHKKYTLGVHQVIAMKYLNYYKGCVVHHKDENPHNNMLYNLQVESRSDHSRLHVKDKMFLANYIKKNGPHNKGMKMSEEFCEKCRQSALKRKDRTFNGNQYVDKFGNKKY